MSRRQRQGLSHVSSVMGDDGLPAGMKPGAGIVDDDLMQRIARCREMAKQIGRVEEEDSEPAPEERAQSAIRQLEGLGVPVMDAEDALKFEDSPKSAVSAVRHHLSERPQTTLVLSGKLGVGKTIASAVWLLRLARKTTQVGKRAWINAVDLCGLSVMDRQAEWPGLVRAPMLAIQDLGEECPSRPQDWHGKLTTLIYDRQRSRRRTCITTNLTPAQLREAYGGRLYDRLRQHAHWVGVEGENLRGAALRH